MHDDAGLRNDIVRVTWLGHASVLVELGGTRLLCDPVVRRRVAHLRRRTRVADAHLETIDAVLVSHAHHDHLDIGSLRRIRRRNPDTIFYAPRGAARVLRRARLDPVVTVALGETRTIGNIDVDISFAAHGGDRSGPRRDEVDAEAVSFVFRGGDAPSVWFAGDTQLDDELGSLAPVDVALVPVGGWWRTLGPGHMDGAEAARAVATVGARVAIPIHWGTYHPALLYFAMAAVWDQPASSFRHACTTIAPNVDVRTLAVGATTQIARTELDEP